MRCTFITKRFSDAHMEVINAADEILSTYAEQGFTLTLRQLYYQFVATQPLGVTFENTQRSYKRLGGIVSNARLAGLLDWGHMEDRTREAVVPASWRSPEELVKSAADAFRRDLWANQAFYVEAWIEKDALVSVLEAACELHRLPYFSCRGYTSLSALYEAGERFRWRARGKVAVVLHLGDHDPSGIDMTRDIEERLSMFAERRVEVRRLALNMPQVRRFNPPPNPAKLSDSRAADYIANYGYESWELDALNPETIRELIHEQAIDMIDWPTWEKNAAREERERAELKAAADNWDDVTEFLNDSGLI